MVVRVANTVTVRTHVPYAEERGEGESQRSCSAHTPHGERNTLRVDGERGKGAVSARALTVHDHTTSTTAHTEWREGAGRESESAQAKCRGGGEFQSTHSRSAHVQAQH